MRYSPLLVFWKEVWDARESRHPNRTQSVTRSFFAGIICTSFWGPLAYASRIASLADCRFSSLRPRGRSGCFLVIFIRVHLLPLRNYSCGKKSTGCCWRTECLYYGYGKTVNLKTFLQYVQKYTNLEQLDEPEPEPKKKDTHKGWIFVCLWATKKRSLPFSRMTSNSCIIVSF